MQLKVEHYDPDIGEIEVSFLDVYGDEQFVRIPVELLPAFEAIDKARGIEEIEGRFFPAKDL